MGGHSRVGQYDGGTEQAKETIHYEDLAECGGGIQKEVEGELKTNSP
ncbi:hypothetical protein GCM10009096_18550 [Parasphingorhabdus litoris]|uniref:Uncharacterized protein n=1 Tax=Parasphingorhabdus litoris TaxID=394733 RepID=A0ABN1AHZ9_9SPHN